MIMKYIKLLCKKSVLKHIFSMALWKELVFNFLNIKKNTILKVD